MNAKVLEIANTEMKNANKILEDRIHQLEKDNETMKREASVWTKKAEELQSALDTNKVIMKSKEMEIDQARMYISILDQLLLIHGKNKWRSAICFFLESPFVFIW